MPRHALPRLFRTASFRLAGLYVLLFGASALILGATVFLAARSALDQQMVARITTETAFLREEFAAGGLDRLVAVVKRRDGEAGALDYLVRDGAGRRLAGEMPADDAPRGAGWTSITVPEERDEDGRAEQVRALVTDLGQGVTLAVADDFSHIVEVEEAVVRALAGALGLAALLGIGGGILLSRTFLARVDRISRTAEAIIAGDLAQRIPIEDTGDDLDRLAVTLNRMLDRICGLMDSLRQISADVAHDLRTPLSRLLQRLDEARRQDRDGAGYEAAIEAATREAEGLLETFSALLRIAQVEGAAPRASFSPVDLGALAETVADAYRPDAEDSGHRLVTELAPGVVIAGDRGLLAQALANLVENALRHAPGGTEIRLRLSADGPHLVLDVEDDGPGVAPDDLPRLTRRFFRTERSRTTPGNGLGLSLVAAIAELHGLILTFENLSPGFRASLRGNIAAGRRDACAPGSAP